MESLKKSADRVTSEEKCLQSNSELEKPTLPTLLNFMLRFLAVTDMLKFEDYKFDLLPELVLDKIPPKDKKIIKFKNYSIL